MNICKNCRQLFDPTLNPRKSDQFADDFLCSYHPGQAVLTENTGPRFDYADVYQWNCCSKIQMGAVINGVDYPPRRSPGCTKGSHVSDDSILLNENLAGELQALQERLREIEAREATSPASGGVFISYCHADGRFVDDLTSRLALDKVTYWRDDKDLLVGEVIDAAISHGIQTNALFLVVLSPSSINSTWLRRELDEAAHEATEGRKVLLPVLANGLCVESAPARIRRFKCADFNSDFQRAYTILLSSIQGHIRRGKTGVS
jgi:hypothetical protein